MESLVLIDLLFQLHLIISESVKDIALLHLIMTYIKENIITKFKK